MAHDLMIECHYVVCCGNMKDCLEGLSIVSSIHDGEKNVPRVQSTCVFVIASHPNPPVQKRDIT